MSNTSDEQLQRDREKAEVMASAEIATVDFVKKWAPPAPRLQQFWQDLQELAKIYTELGGLSATEVILSIVEQRPKSDRPS